jgi:hypothetical protein
MSFDKHMELGNLAQSIVLNRLRQKDPTAIMYEPTNDGRHLIDAMLMRINNEGEKYMVAIEVKAQSNTDFHGDDCFTFISGQWLEYIELARTLGIDFQMVILNTKNWNVYSMPMSKALAEHESEGTKFPFLYKYRKESNMNREYDKYYVPTAWFTEFDRLNESEIKIYQNKRAILMTNNRPPLPQYKQQ